MRRQGLEPRTRGLIACQFCSVECPYYLVRGDSDWCRRVVPGPGGSDARICGDGRRCCASSGTIRSCPSWLQNVRAVSEQLGCRLCWSACRWLSGDLLRGECSTIGDRRPV